MATNNTPSELAPPTPDGFTTRPPSGPTEGKPKKPWPEGVIGYKWSDEYGVWMPQYKDGDPPDDPGRPAKPADPYAPVIRQFFASYLNLWGTLPPPGYVEKRAREMNLFEFLEAERKKPAFRETKTYRDEAARFAAMRDQLLGYY